MVRILCLVLTELTDIISIWSSGRGSRIMLDSAHVRIDHWRCGFGIGYTLLFFWQSVLTKRSSAHVHVTTQGRSSHSTYNCRHSPDTPHSRPQIFRRILAATCSHFCQALSLLVLNSILNNLWCLKRLLSTTLCSWSKLVLLAENSTASIDSILQVVVGSS